MKFGDLAIFAKVGWDILENRLRYSYLAPVSILFRLQTYSKSYLAQPRTSVVSKPEQNLVPEQNVCTSVLPICTRVDCTFLYGQMHAGSKPRSRLGRIASTVDLKPHELSKATPSASEHRVSVSAAAAAAHDRTRQAPGARGAVRVGWT